MSKPKNFSGLRYGRLVGIQRVGVSKDGQAIWEWRCDCGQMTHALGYNVMRGLTSSCGCLQQENRVKHGMYKTRAYRAWLGMKARVAGNGDMSVKHYVERGIKVCPEWQDNFVAFFDAMEECPTGMELDRIDNDGNYEPGNCRWATRTQQMANTRRTHIVICYGDHVCLSEACRRMRISYRTVMKRMARGMSAQQAISL